MFVLYMLICISLSSVSILFVGLLLLSACSYLPCIGEQEACNAAAAARSTPPLLTRTVTNFKNYLPRPLRGVADSKDFRKASQTYD